MRPFQGSFLWAAMSLSSDVCVAQDSAGCKDSPLIGRFPGPFAPLASNYTEHGRAVNRRVELVKQ